MIEDLLKIADLQGLTGRESVHPRAIHWLIDLDADGHMLQLSPTVKTSKAKSGKLHKLRGKLYMAPNNYHMRATEAGIGSVGTNDSNWAPRFLTFAAPEFFAGDVLGFQSKSPGRDRRRRLRTWRIILEAARKSNLETNGSMLAVIRFLRSRPRLDPGEIPVDDLDERARISKAIAEGKELLSFRVAGHLLIQDPQIRQWWAGRVARMRDDVCHLLPHGEDSYESGVGSLAEYHPRVFSSIPLFSYDKAPFVSFGLGRQTTRLRLETSEKMAAALNWLLNDESSRLKLGEYTAVFWATTDDRSVPVGFAQLLDSGDPLAVRDFLEGPWSGTVRHLDTAKFHAALLRKSGKGRFAINSWYTDTLDMAQQNLKSWYRAIEVPSNHSPDRVFNTIRELSECTVRKSRKTRPLPATYRTLFDSAVFGSPLPQKLLAAVLARQSLELAKGADKKKPKEFECRLTARTSLVQAFFALKKGPRMTNSTQNLEASPGYWCGRMLAILDRIHVEAHDNKTSSSPANRSYGAASTAPALIFPQLCKLARVHLAKVKGKRDKHGNKAEKCLEFGYPRFDPPLEGLANVCAKLRDKGAEFPRTLTLEQQGHFAIGFYYERCLRWPKYGSGSDINVADESTR